MKADLVTIIIPIYNREDIVKQTLDSIIDQVYINWECIIIDDGSTDKTINVLKSYCKKDHRFQYYKRSIDKVKGANACRNYGFELSRGKYINWFDSDDIMHPEFLNEKVKSFVHNTNAVLHRNKYANYELTRFRDSKYQYSKTFGLLYSYLNEDIEIQTCGFMWRKSFLLNKSLFDETLERYQDNEFHIRMLALQPNVKILKNVLATIRGGDGDASQISSKQNLTKKKLLDVFYFRCQSFKIFKSLNLEEKKHVFLAKKLLKKIIWSFYQVLYIEKNIWNRIKDLKRNRKELKIVFLNKNLVTKERLKSFGYLCYIVFIGRRANIKN